MILENVQTRRTRQSTSVAELTDSRLSTLAYWESWYRAQIAEYRKDGTIIGMEWFDEDCIENVCEWIGRCDRIAASSAIADLGCGPALVLVELARNGHTELYGYDYSPAAVKLAKVIAKSADIYLTLTVKNLLKRARSLSERFDVVHDKGTYDTIGLHPHDATLRCKRYVKNVAAMLKRDGLLILTSSNWTESELEEQLAERFELYDSIPTAMYRSGRKLRRIYTTAVFAKKSTTTAARDFETFL